MIYYLYLKIGKIMKPRQYVHTLLILSEAIIISCCLIMIIKYDHTDIKRKIWIASKILTFQIQLEKNNFYSYPILSIDSYAKTIIHNQNYESLLKHSAEKCEVNYKKCGILDTYGNIMCIPKNDECPINDIKVDLCSKLNDYISKGYRVAYLKEIQEEYCLYYTNTKINNEIIVKMKISDEIPRYINEDNFIFASKIYYSLRSSEGHDRDDFDFDYDRDYDEFGDDIGSGGGGFRNIEEIYGDEDVTGYIKKRFEEDINIDKSFKKVGTNLYVGNYYGFKDNSHLQDYIKTDLYKLYTTIFPNIGAHICSYISIGVLIFLIIFSIIRFCHKDIPNEGFNPSAVCTAKFFTIFPYLVIFIGYFIYIIYEYINIYKKNNPESLIKINADSFLENLLEEIHSRHLKKVYILILIILFSCSIILNIIAWILSSIFTCKFMKLMKNSNSSEKSKNPLM